MLERDMLDVITQTNILEMCQQMIVFSSPEKEVYFLKLEALWLLNNFVTAEPLILRTLQSQLDLDSIIQSQSDLKFDFMNL